MNPNDITNNPNPTAGSTPSTTYQIPAQKADPSDLGIQFSLQCPDCSESITATAANKLEGLKKILGKYSEHFKAKGHTNQLSDEEIAALVQPQ
jgi:hypothetical protein